MIKVIQQDTTSRNKEFEDKYALFKELFYTTNMTRDEILKELDMSPNSKVYKNILKKWAEEEEITTPKRAKLICFGKWV